MSCTAYYGKCGFSAINQYKCGLQSGITQACWTFILIKTLPDKHNSLYLLISNSSWKKRNYKQNYIFVQAE